MADQFDRYPVPPPGYEAVFVDVKYLDEMYPRSFFAGYRRVESNQAAPRAATWTCTYCGGVRFGLSCVGCGAPRIAAEAVARGVA